ncbi:actin-related protein [Anaeramoeba ignava]|uniref:Actin-related protein n=1 Tax=Anaeramoeba ignava TaxID=1746090 RepID=A0A9Q0LN76_ANAIG|nr:actin-related protein [Anaeramoeba ignava]
MTDRLKLGLLSEKTIIVIEFGSYFIKCGFAGDSSPRYFIKLNSINPETKEKLFPLKKTNQITEQSWIHLVNKGLNLVFLKYLQVNTKDIVVIICDDVLFPFVLFAPNPFLTLIPYKKKDGLIIDCGRSETRIIPVYEGVPLYSNLYYTELGMIDIIQNLRELLILNLEEKSQITKEMIQEIDDETLEDIISKIVFIRGKYEKINPNQKINKKQNELIKKLQIEKKPKENQKEMEKLEIEDIKIPIRIKEKNYNLIIKGKIRGKISDILFEGKEENEFESIIDIFIECLKSCNCDVRASVSQNIILCGGTSMIPGFLSRLREEVDFKLDNDEYFKDVQFLKGKLHFNHNKKNANYISWIGGSVIGSLNDIVDRSLKREVYLEKGSKSFQDWSNFFGYIQDF